MAEASELRAAYDAMVAALGRGDLEAFYGAMLTDAVAMDEDLPFRVDRASFQAHNAFHGPAHWEGFAYKPYHVSFAARGGAGVAAGFAMFRGQPKDSGFRLRPMLFLQGWTRTPGGWKLASWQQRPIVSHVMRPSPG